MEKQVNETEGVIKYHLNHQYIALSPTINIDALNAWRSVLFKMKLIGQDDQRYGGLGYGNLSQRIDEADNSFIISGSQTGHLPSLSLADYALVQAFDIEQYSLRSIGLRPPSSETLTHASIYAQRADAQCVIHVHSPVIWSNTIQLGLPNTGENIAYGTLEMAYAFANCLDKIKDKTAAIISMLGHRDGIVVYANSIERASHLLVETQAEAIRISTQTVISQDPNYA